MAQSIPENIKKHEANIQLVLQMDSVHLGGVRHSKKTAACDDGGNSHVSGRGHSKTSRNASRNDTLIFSTNQLAEHMVGRNGETL